MLVVNSWFCRQLVYHWPYRDVTYVAVLLLVLERYVVVVNPNMCLRYRSFMSLFETMMSLWGENEEIKFESLGHRWGGNNAEVTYSGVFSNRLLLLLYLLWKDCYTVQNVFRQLEFLFSHQRGSWLYSECFCINVMFIGVTMIKFVSFIHLVSLDETILSFNFFLQGS